MTPEDLHRARRRLGMTKIQFAAALDLASERPDRAVRDLERGKTKITVRIIDRTRALLLRQNPSSQPRRLRP